MCVFSFLDCFHVFVVLAYRLIIGLQTIVYTGYLKIQKSIVLYLAHIKENYKIKVKVPIGRLTASAHFLKWKFESVLNL